MKERPIIMGAESVLGILNDHKTHTRRVIKPREIERMEYKERVTWARNVPIFVYHCPYGQVGDHLWVREAWRTEKSIDRMSAAQMVESCLDAGYRTPWAPIRYEADGKYDNWDSDFYQPENIGRLRLPLFMPRWASRLTLEIVSINAERLQDITNEGATQEGGCDSRDHFADYWDTINATRGYPWASNPWVWEIGFKKVMP